MLSVTELIPVVNGAVLQLFADYHTTENFILKKELKTNNIFLVIYGGHSEEQHLIYIRDVFIFFIICSTADPFEW